MKNTFLQDILEAHKQASELPSTESVRHFIDRLLGFLFPIRCEKNLKTIDEVEKELKAIREEFEGILSHIEACDHEKAPSICASLFNTLEELRNSCIDDAKAILAGDPAAVNLAEVVGTYPGFYAIAIYRVAHLLHGLEVPYLPRILTEHAHALTGIDIHPGAKIGHSFCIDHGTGIVIGETTEIGNGVKIYQGVTLGGLSVKKSMAATKRHPTIEDGVTIYSGTTILGGDTVIGKDSMIGGNVWLTESVPENSFIYYSPEGLIKSR
ncbi:MAG TPA: serine O-acetyltransferase EpsC [Saprospiraceae bacterium]|nr:serine O-acetyltransferase EpsC [Saprospiraceae bacterium]